MFSKCVRCDTDEMKDVSGREGKGGRECLEPPGLEGMRERERGGEGRGGRG